jgi:hypothetical protein
MAVAAHVNQYQDASKPIRANGGLFSRFMQRVMFACEARAIYRLESEFSHLLEAGHMKELKADMAVRKARAGL